MAMKNVLSRGTLLFLLLPVRETKRKSRLFTPLKFQELKFTVIPCTNLNFKFEPKYPRWYAKHGRLNLGEVKVPYLFEDDPESGVLVLRDYSIPVLWPWDLIHWRFQQGILNSWITNNPEKAHMKCQASRPLFGNFCLGGG